MVMRIGGLASGMDIDSIVEKLMQAERIPVDKLSQKKQTYEWQRDAYRDVNTKLKTLDTYIADNLILKTMNAKTATSSNSEYVNATATGSATGSLVIAGVSQLAKAATGVGTTIAATKDTKLSDLGITSTSVKLNTIQKDGTMKESEIKFSVNDTMEQFVNKLNSSGAGVNAIFENGKLSISAQNTGDNKAGAEIEVMSGAGVFDKLGFTSNNLATGGQNAKFQVNGISSERTTNEFSINGYNVQLKKTFNEASVDTEALTQSKDLLKSTLTQLADKYNLTIENPENNAADFAAKMNENIVKVTNELNAELSTLQADFDTADAAARTAENKTLDSINDKTAGEVYENLSEEAKDLISSYREGQDLSAITLSDEEKDLLGLLTQSDIDMLNDVKTKTSEAVLKGEELAEVQSMKTNLDNQITDYNNKRTSLATTTVTIPEVTLSSTTDVDGMMNKIKEFVTTYNSFVKELTDKTKETKYRDYAPLTAEQKKDMEEEEIKLWEEKSKSGLLRNDSLVRNGLADMRSLVYATHEGVANSKFSSLYSVGIGTSKSYNDGGTLEIDEEKLRKAIEEDPNAVEQLFKNPSGEKEDTVTYTTIENGVEVEKTKTADTRGFLYQLRDSMKQMEVNIEKKAGRATMTDAQYSLGKLLTDTNNRLDSWEDKLKNIESRYWKQFTAMETAINNANQQSSLFMQG